jgi:hypothetical protein
MKMIKSIARKVGSERSDNQQEKVILLQVRAIQNISANQ